MTDLRTILTANRLVDDGHITPEERRLLVVDNGQIVDDSRFPVDVCENRDVWIHRRGAIPYRLQGYAT
jgi:hypothetical protein